MPADQPNHPTDPGQRGRRRSQEGTLTADHDGLSTVFATGLGGEPRRGVAWWRDGVFNFATPVTSGAFAVPHRLLEWLGPDSAMGAVWRPGLALAGLLPEGITE